MLGGPRTKTRRVVSKINLFNWRNVCLENGGAGWDGGLRYSDVVRRRRKCYLLKMDRALTVGRSLSTYRKNVDAVICHVWLCDKKATVRRKRAKKRYERGGVKSVC